MSNLYDMTDLEIAISFVEFIPVEGVFQNYADWMEDKIAIDTKIKRLVTSLEAGGLTRELRKQKTKQRDKFKLKLKTDDPRLLQKIRYDHWLQTMGVDEEDIPKARDYAAKKLESAMKDSEAIKQEGLPPFVLVRAGTGSHDHYKIMDLKDYAIESVSHKGTKDEEQAIRQQKEFERLMLTVKDHYGELPIELEAAAENVRMTIDFKRRMANVLGDMVHESMKVIEHQNMKTTAVDELIAIEDEFTDTVDQQQ